MVQQIVHASNTLLSSIMQDCNQQHLLFRWGYKIGTIKYLVLYYSRLKATYLTHL